MRLRTAHKRRSRKMQREVADSKKSCSQLLSEIMARMDWDKFTLLYSILGECK